MKKLITINLLLALTMPVLSFAATPAGLTPKSPFYFLDTLFERINLALTFNPEKKATKALLFAEERLAEVATTTDEDKPEVIGALMANYENNVSLATEKSKEVKDEKKAEELFNKIADNTAKHQEVLTEVLAKVPEEAKDAITKAIEASKKGQEEALKQIAELRQEVTELKQEIAELKKQQKTEPTSTQNIDAQSQSAIQELRKEITELKKQVNEKPTVVPSTQVVPAAPIATPPPMSTATETPTISVTPTAPATAPTEKNYYIQFVYRVKTAVTLNKSFLEWLQNSNSQLRSVILVLSNHSSSELRSAHLDYANAVVSVNDKMIVNTNKNIVYWENILNLANNHPNDFVSQSTYDSLKKAEDLEAEIENIKIRINADVRKVLDMPQYYY